MSLRFAAAYGGGDGSQLKRQTGYNGEAFWMLADNGGWPPEIDVMEGRGQRPGDLVMSTHWRIPTTQKIEVLRF